MRILVISAYPFPIGYSATNRILSYSKGLVELGHSVKHFSLRPTEKQDNVINQSHQGVFEGVEFEYTNGTTKWSRSKFIMLLQALYGYLKSFYILLNSKYKNPYDFVLISNDNVYYILFLSFYLKILLRIRTVLIVDEFPYVLRESIPIYRYFPLLLKLEPLIGYRFFDGIITMTRPLKEYFSRYKNDLCMMKIIPMTVEPDRFNIKRHEIPKEKYIAYIGDLVKDKDGVDDAISAFYIISNKYPEYKFYIIGSAKNEIDFERLKELVTNYKLTDRIKFLGKIDRNEVPSYLCGASLLILARPDNQRAKGGFPTKLGEYLATGNPVVVTDVGEISMYLTDGVNAFISKTNDPSEFAEKIDEALSNPNKSKAVGIKGKELAYGVFNYRIQARNIAEFLISL
ncbi:MAG: glycosyltransferase family 4 protein [Ignavibacteria bacterium]